MFRNRIISNSHLKDIPVSFTKKKPLKPSKESTMKRKNSHHQEDISRDYGTFCPP